MCSRSRVLQPNGTKEASWRAEPCGSRRHCGASARSSPPAGAHNPVPSCGGTRAFSRLRHCRGLPPERCEEPTQRWAQSRRRCLRLRGVGRALCLRLQHPRSDQTHPDHTCITERPLAWIGFIFWYKSHDCPAAFESCDVTVSNSYTVSLQLSRLTHTLGDGALNASWLWKRAANA